jgi:hypothetical protein
MMTSSEVALLFSTKVTGRVISLILKLHKGASPQSSDP